MKVILLLLFPVFAACQSAKPLAFGNGRDKASPLIVLDANTQDSVNVFSNAPPTANAGKDDTLYFPNRWISLRGKCTGATSRQWTVLRTSLPAPTTDSANVDIYKIYIDYRLTCRAGTQSAYDDKRITLVYDPNIEFTIFDAGIFGKWAIMNNGHAAIIMGTQK